MEEGLVALVIANAAFVAAMGPHMYPTEFPERATVGATYQVVGGSSEPTFETSGMQRVRFQFDFRAPTKAVARAGRKALRDLIEGYRGTLTDGTFIQGCDWIQDIDFFDSEPRLHRCMSEYYFTFCLP